ncbi:hybrid sensor histidine kinase/response regulator transcription factor [Flavitalea flava]
MEKDDVKNIRSRLWLSRVPWVRSLSLLLLFFCSIPGTGFPQSHPYQFNYLTVDEGLSHTDANDIAQDKQGYIWVATYFGLSRFDGYSVKRYYNNNSPLINAFKNRLRCLYPDDAGNIWLGTEDGLQCFNAGSEKYIDYNVPGVLPHPLFEKLFKPAGNILYGLLEGELRLFSIKGEVMEAIPVNNPPGIRFSDMAPDGSGHLYLAGNNGVWKLDRDRRLKHISITDLQEEYLKDLSVLHFDGMDTLLVSSVNHVFLLVKSPGSEGKADTEHWAMVKHFASPANSYIKNILSCQKPEYWVNTEKDVYRLDKNLQFLQLVNSASSIHSLNSASLTKMLIDRSECLWVCSFGGGVNYCDLNEKLFFTLQHNPGSANSLSGNHIRSILRDGENLWIGTMSGGLNLYNTQTQTFTLYNSHNTPVKLKNDIITSITFDDKRNLWIGSNAGIEILQPDRKQLWRPPGYDKFPNYVIETLVKDCYGNIWFGNHMNRYGVIWKDHQGQYNVRYYDEGYSILPDKHKPQLFISSTHGLKRVIIDPEGNIIKTFYYKASSDGHSLSSNYTYPVRMQNDSTWWIGTMGGGLNRLTLQTGTDSFSIKSFGTDYGVFNDVESLEIDKEGNIWIGGNGLECLNPTTGKLIRYDKNDGLQGNSFKVGSSYNGMDGKLYFGGINGLNYFNPALIRANDIDARPVLTDILINNQKPRYGKEDARSNSISQAIGYGKDLRLNYRQNNFVISFSSMHYANPLKCKYRYQLAGFDKGWIYTYGENPRAAYSNLDFNHYTFVVEASNNDGIWSKSRAELTIILTPPWWKSPIAKMTYALLALLALSGIYIYQARWYRLKRELEVRAVNEKLYEQQLVFFTNVSHEFRTPLTLILGPLESLISQNKNLVLDNSYKLMQRNAKRLINLISELMNFKKIADSVIKLQVRPLSINAFCKEMASEFNELANGKDINFTMTDHTNTLPEATGPFDVQVLEKILFNLLNNSFKYTNAGGQISFDIFTDLAEIKPSFTTGFQLLHEGRRAKRYIYFRVADTGIGISGDSLKNIFERYYRISKNHLGSGVGLAIVKSLTQLHKGDIYVNSERHKGTEIIIGIPWGEENYSASEKAVSMAGMTTRLEPIDISTLLPLSYQEKEKFPEVAKFQKNILLVDDNQELRVFLKQAFEKYYSIYEAEDGHAAIEIAVEKVPDLIISDVMMPGMNGIELCKIVKERFETSHIPFIILSAKDALDTKIEGMESGADYYFAKPLSIDLLLLTVNNIFEQNKKLKQRFTNDYLSEATELVSSEKDKDFLQQLSDLIEEHMSDPALDAEFLCDKLYISRTKLYQKIKSIADQSVAEFIRTFRLKKAVQIMTHEDIAMNDVADRIGMQSASNFSRTFKKEFGKSPLQFMQALKKKER